MLTPTLWAPLMSMGRCSSRLTLPALPRAHLQYVNSRPCLRRLVPYPALESSETSTVPTMPAPTLHPRFGRRSPALRPLLFPPPLSSLPHISCLTVTSGLKSDLRLLDCIELLPNLYRAWIGAFLGAAICTGASP